MANAIIETVKIDGTWPAIGGVAIDVSGGNQSLAATNARALYVGGAGNVSVKTVDDSDLVFVGVPAGSIIPVRVNTVNQSGTTATSIIALW